MAPTPTSSVNSASNNNNNNNTTSMSCNHQETTFLRAVRRGDAHELQRILQLWEVNVNVFDQEGQTALHQSCMDGNLELVKLLVKFGANVKLANRDGWSALHIAAYGGHQEITLYLIANTRR